MILSFLAPSDRKDIFMSIFRSAESVSPKHPDKLCDQISDAILDAYLANDPDSRVAIETVGGHGKVLVIGEVTSDHKVEIEPIVKRIAGVSVDVEARVVKQSSEIAQGVDNGGAGDQGIMVGYACRDTPELLPLETVLSRRLNKSLYSKWPYDGKTQITLKDGIIESVVASFQNAPAAELAKSVKQWLKLEELARYKSDVILCVNPAGDWEIGGFSADTGLTGRKLVVDNYGPHIPIGGGAFSGKDPSKVDRSAAYMARRIAIDYLLKRQAKETFVELAYAIGRIEPLEATVTIDGAKEVISGYDLSPRGIISYLDLKHCKYEPTAQYGHFGHDEFSWEKR